MTRVGQKYVKQRACFRRVPCARFPQGTPGRVVLIDPFFSGPSGYPQSGTRLIGTVLDGLPAHSALDFLSLKIAPGGTLHSADKWVNKNHPAQCAANVIMPSI